MAEMHKSIKIQREQQLIVNYYKNIFPADLLVRLYSSRKDQYGHKLEMMNREVAIRLIQRSSGNSVFSRYYSPGNPNNFRTLLIQESPTDVFIGAGYNRSPCVHKETRGSNKARMAAKRKATPLPAGLKPFIAIHHEFVIDIDLSDYDSIRVCCQNRSICMKCWRFASAACEILDMLLGSKFGVRHRLWLYSGGRGIHCWCLDSEMLTMDRERRGIMIDYIQGLFSLRTPKSEALHRHLEHNDTVLDILKIAGKYVRQILDDQNYFKYKAGQVVLLDNVKSYLEESDSKEDNEYSAKIREFISTEKAKNDPPLSSANPTIGTTKNVSLQIYDQLVIWSKISRNSNLLLKRIMLHLIYPRLDAPVSRDPSHLLRCPFSLHRNNRNHIVMPFLPENVAHLLTDTSNGLLRIRTDSQWLRDRPFKLYADLGAMYHGPGGPGGEPGLFEQSKQILADICDALEKESAFGVQPESNEPVQIKELSIQVTPAPLTPIDTPIDVVGVNAHEPEPVQMIELSIQVTPAPPTPIDTPIDVVGDNAHGPEPVKMKDLSIRVTPAPPTPIDTPIDVVGDNAHGPEPVKMKELSIRVTPAPLTPTTPIDVVGDNAHGPEPVKMIDVAIQVTPEEFTPTPGPLSAEVIDVDTYKPKPIMKNVSIQVNTKELERDYCCENY